MSEGSREEYCVGVCDVDVDGLSWVGVGLNSNLSNRRYVRMTTTRNYYRKENERGDMHGRRRCTMAHYYFILLGRTINFVRVKYTHYSRSAPCVQCELLYMGCNSVSLYGYVEKPSAARSKYRKCNF